MSNISYEVYMVKTVIYHTLEMSTIVLYLCMVTICTYICTGESKNSRSSVVYVCKESTLAQQDPFLVQGVYHLLVQVPGLATCHGRMYHVAIYTFMMC